jgi:hypothetical protein
MRVPLYDKRGNNTNRGQWYVSTAQSIPPRNFTPISEPDRAASSRADPPVEAKQIQQPADTSAEWLSGALCS